MVERRTLNFKLLNYKTQNCEKHCECYFKLLNIWAENVLSTFIEDIEEEKIYIEDLSIELREKLENYLNV